MNNIKIVKNASWIIVSKVLQSIIGLLVSIFTARYLGPSNYGLISYASSLVGFVSPIAFLGINNVLVQELTTRPEYEGEIMGSSIIMSIISAVCCIIGIYIFIFFVDAGNTETIIVCVLYSLILLFQALDLIQYWFQAKLMSKYSSLVVLFSFILISIYKIFLLIFQKNVYWFAIANTIDYLMISICLIILYFKLGGKKLSFSYQMCKDIFSKSKHFIITGLMISIFAQTDKIMLKLMIGETYTGFYSAAVSCATMVSFVYAAIIDSFRPVLFKNYEQDIDLFELNLKRLYSIVIYLSLVQSIFMTLLAKPIINILYGNDFINSINSLRIICWYVTFSYMGSVRNIWILCKNKQKYLMLINLSGAIINVILNLVLIPRMGINGAALASLITQFFTNFFIAYIIKPISDNNKYILQALNLKYIFSMIKSLKRGNQNE